MNKGIKRLAIAMVVVVVLGWLGMFIHGHRLVMVIYQPNTTPKKGTLEHVIRDVEQQQGIDKEKVHVAVVETKEKDRHFNAAGNASNLGRDPISTPRAGVEGGAEDRNAKSKSKLPRPIVRQLWNYHDDGNNDCWTGARDFEKRPVVIFQQGADQNMRRPPLDLCDVPCFITGNGAMMRRADVFPAWETVFGGSGCEHQKTAWITMENYQHRSPPNAHYKMTVSLQSEVPVPYLSWFDFKPLRPMNVSRQRYILVRYIYIYI